MNADANGNPIVNIPPKRVEIQYLDFTKEERDIYDSLFKDSRTKFDHYCTAGKVLSNYAHIFSILLRLRQVCDHPFLVLSSGNFNTEKYTFDVKEMVEKFLNTDENAVGAGNVNTNNTSNSSSSTSTSGTINPDSKLKFVTSVIEELQNNNAPRECPICFNDLEAGVFLPCCHSFCRECIVDYLERKEQNGEEGDCPQCRFGPIKVDTLVELVRTEEAPVVEDSGEGEKDVAEEGKSGSASTSTSSSSNSSNSSSQLSKSASTSGGGIKFVRNNFKSSTKLDSLLDELKQIRKSDPSIKSVVFSQFTGMLDLIEIMFKTHNIGYVRFDGSLTQDARAKVLTEFTKSSRATVMIASLRSCGVGLNLTVASRCFLLDPWWSSAVESQAIDRIHRLGQQREVVVKRYIVRGTVEEKMLKIQEQKDALASCALTMSEAEKTEQRKRELFTLFDR